MPPIFKNKICRKIRIKVWKKNIGLIRLHNYEQFLSWIFVVTLALFKFNKVTSKEYSGANSVRKEKSIQNELKPVKCVKENTEIFLRFIQRKGKKKSQG